MIKDIKQIFNKLFCYNLSRKEKLFYITRWQDVGCLYDCMRQARWQGFVDDKLRKQILLSAGFIISLDVKTPTQLRRKIFSIFRVIKNLNSK